MFMTPSQGPNASELAKRARDSGLDQHGDAKSFSIRDSGKREEFEGGMVRDTEDGKTDFLLTRDGPMYRRWAIHLTKGAKKYAPRNWMKGQGEAELQRARRSAVRHFEQWLDGMTDEDHAAAVFFNINQVEHLKEKRAAAQRLQAHNSG